MVQLVDLCLGDNDGLAQQKLQRVAGRLETKASLFFSEQSLVYGALACIVDPVGNAGKAGIDAGEMEIVIDLVKQIAEGRSIAVPRANETPELRRQLLPDGFFEYGAAEARAGGEEAIEVTARGFIEVAVGFVGAGRGNNALAQLNGAGDGGLDKLQEFEGEGRAEEIILLPIEGALNRLPNRRGSAGALDTGERGKALTRVLDEAVTHLEGKLTPSGDECGGVGGEAGVEFAVDHRRKNGAQFSEAPAMGKLSDSFAELAARRNARRQGEQLLLELGNGQGQR